MKSSLVILVALLMALTATAGAPAGLAQVGSSSGDAPPTNPSPPTDACAPADDGTLPDGCTPTPMLDTPTPASVATDTPTPAAVATETPTPLAVATDTPTRVPTETPTPASASTRTPQPQAATPTPTSAAKDVPAGTLAAQLPFGNPSDLAFACEPLVASANAQQPCAAQAFPALFTLTFPASWSNTVPIALQVDKKPADPASKLTWDFLSVPGSGPSPRGNSTTISTAPGAYLLSATQKLAGSAPSNTLTVQLTVTKPIGPHFLVYPRSVAPGSKAQVWLAGFPTNTVEPLGVYVHDETAADCKPLPSPCYRLVHNLGTVKTDGAGTATTTLSVAATDPPGAYLVASPNMPIKSGPGEATDSLLLLGKPWFAVEQPQP